jgi:hypothetical protein
VLPRLRKVALVVVETVGDPISPSSIPTAPSASHASTTQGSICESFRCRELLADLLHSIGGARLVSMKGGPGAS